MSDGGALIITEQFLIAFLLVFARVAGLFTFLPLPGSSLFPGAVKAALILLVTLVLLPSAAIRASAENGMGTICVWVLRETAFGMAAGVALQFLNEMLGLAAQILGFQAGYSYVNTIDPSTQVDAAILNVLLTLLGGLLFFSLDLHLEVVRALAWKLQTVPVGQSVVGGAGAGLALAMVRLGGVVFDVAVRLAFPVVAVLLLLDLALAFLSYVNGRMQLLSLAFPAKMSVAMVSLAALMAAVPRLYEELARQAMAVACGILRRW